MEKPIPQESYKNLPESPSFVDICTLNQHAMRYYRLWIYACNFVLAVATLVFTIFAVSVLVDPRISLLSGVDLWQPSFLYAYLALLFQCGILQTIGYLGALRLNQKLLNIYWYLLLVLMIGDILVGLVWAFKLVKIKSSLKPRLHARLIEEYGTDSRFTEIWDWVQKTDQCCGVDSPYDFHKLNGSLSSSSSYENNYEINGISQESTITTAIPTTKLPGTCCSFTQKSDVEDENGREHRHHMGFDNTNFHMNNRINHNYPSGSGEYYSSNNNNNNRRNPPPLGFPPSIPSSSSGTNTILQSKNMHVNRRKIYHGTRKHLDQIPLMPTSSSFGHLNKNHLNDLHNGNNWDAKMFLANNLANLACELPHHFYPKPTTLRDSSNNNNNNNPPTSGSDYASSNQGNSLEEGNTDENDLNSEKGGRSSHTSSTTVASISSILMSLQVEQHTEGCGDKIIYWIDHVTDVLFVIGFCIIVFLKGCFLAILRYEIKEMIQKIRLLNGEDGGQSAAMNELIGLTSIYNSQDEEGGRGAENGGENGSEVHNSMQEQDSRTSDPRQSSIVTSSMIGGPAGSVTVSKPFENHIGSNNTGGMPISSTRVEIQDDFDRSNSILRRVSKHNKTERSGGPRNGNNNNSGSGVSGPLSTTT